ncbi:MAG TPA: TrkA family potassium uptake protein [Vicinamibacterales bacterium]|jgi:voltage-gated potassium channel
MTTTGDRALRSRQLQLAIALLALVLAAGTIGYTLIEGWSVWDALFTTVVSVTTVGSSKLERLSPAGQVFTVLLLIVGVGTAFYAFTLVAAGVIESRLHPRNQERRRARMIDALTDHFILCGAGRIGLIIAEEFRRQKVKFVVIDRDREAVQAVLDRGDVAIEADASREDILKKIRIDKARGLIAALGTDAENVYAILTARGLRPDLYVIARADSEDAGRKLLRAGANRVISPYQIGATQMAQTALRPAVVDFVELATSSENLELAMEQISIGATSGLASRTIVDANLRQRFGVIVVGIQRDNGRMEFNPAPDAVMRSGDQLVVLGRPEQLKGLEVAAQ